MAYIICVHTSKGGTGKSTITTLLASFFCYEKRYRVLIIDTDSPQFSIENLRQRELLLYEELRTKMQGNFSMSSATSFSTTDLSMFERYQHNKAVGIVEFYPIYTLDIRELASLDMHKLSQSFDYIFFDLGGKFDASITKVLSVVQLVLVPFTTQHIDVMASLEYCLTLGDFHKEGLFDSAVQFRCFWNKYKFTFEKKANIIELQLEEKFAHRAFPMTFLKNRLNDADAGFDRTKMLTTISTPMLCKGGQYVQQLCQFAEEVLHTLNK